MKYFENFDLFSDVQEYDIVSIFNTLREINESIGTTYMPYSEAVKQRRSINEDWEFLSNEFIKKGYFIEGLKKFFSDINTHNIDIDTDVNGLTDLFLYKITDNKNYLVGYDIREMYDDTAEEWLIKYEYGWTTSEYGQLAINHYFGSIDNFFKTFFDALEQHAQNYTKLNKTVLENPKTFTIYTDDPNGLVQYLIDKFILETYNALNIDINAFNNSVTFKFK